MALSRPRRAWATWIVAGSVAILGFCYVAGGLVPYLLSAISRSTRSSEFPLPLTLLAPYVVVLPGVVAAVLLVLDGPVRRPRRERALLAAAAVGAFAMLVFAFSPLGIRLAR